MYDFKTFAQMNLDLIFQGFDRMPQPGEEVFAKRFTMQLGGGPIVCPIVLEQLGFRVRLGTFLGQDDVSNLCRRLLDQRGFSSYDEFAQDNPDPVVVTSVFSWEHDRGFLAHNEGVYESILDPETVYGFLRDAKVVFAPVGQPEVTRRLHEEGVKVAAGAMTCPLTASRRSCPISMSTHPMTRRHGSWPAQMTWRKLSAFWRATRLTRW